MKVWERPRTESDFVYAAFFLSIVETKLMRTLNGVVGEWTIEGEKRNHTGGIVRRALAISCDILYGFKFLHTISETLVAEVKQTA